MSKFRTNPAERHLTLVSSEYQDASRFGCSACGATSGENFVICLRCGTLDTAVEIEEESSPDPTDEPSKRAINARFIATRKLAYVPTGRPAWDTVLGGGVVRGSSLLVAGRGGVGKSTSALDVALHVAGELGGTVVYASSERPREYIKQVAESLGYTGRALDRLFIQDSKELGDAISDVDELRPAVVVWDSIQRFRVEGRLGDRALESTVTHAIERGAAIDAFTILVSQVTKDGTPTGPNGIDHDADAVIFLRRTRSGRVVVECPEKNRFGPTPTRAIEGAAKRRR
jgi:DNA repair protein RadA/Sms